MDFNDSIFNRNESCLELPDGMEDKIRSYLKRSEENCLLAVDALADSDCKEEYYRAKEILKSLRWCLGELANSEELKRIAKYSPERVNLYTYFEQLFDACREQMSEYGILMSFDCEEDIDVFVDVDRLTVCLLNLIVNAVQNTDYTAEEAFIRIEANALEDEVIIDFIDNGYGMGEEELERVMSFEGPKGGLYVVNRFCKRAGSGLKLSSAVDEGFTASFGLPLAKGADRILASEKRLVKSGKNSLVAMYISKLDDPMFNDM